MGLGWEVGDKVEILEDKKEIVLRRVRVPDVKQLRLPHLDQDARGGANDQQGEAHSTPDPLVPG